MIYYGTEVSLTQGAAKSDRPGTEPSRGLMTWGAAQNRDLLEFYQSLLLGRAQARPWERRNESPAPPVEVA